MQYFDFLKLLNFFRHLQWISKDYLGKVNFLSELTLWNILLFNKIFGMNKIIVIIKWGH